MSLESVSPKKLAVFLIAGGLVAVFFISGFQARNLFAPSITEEVQVLIKQGNVCVLELLTGFQGQYLIVSIASEMPY